MNSVKRLTLSLLLLTFIVLFCPSIANSTNLVDYYLPKLGMSIAFPTEMRVTAYNKRNSDNEKLRSNISSDYNFDKDFSNELYLLSYGLSMSDDGESVYLSDITVKATYSGMSNSTENNISRLIEAAKNSYPKPDEDIGIRLVGNGYASILYLTEDMRELKLVTCQNNYDIKITLRVPTGISAEDVSAFVDDIYPTISFQAFSGSSNSVRSDTTAKKSQFIGTVEIVKSGYMNVREKPSTDSKTVFRVHVYERYLCISKNSGWYQILLPTGDTGYVSSSASNTSFSSSTSGITLSNVPSTFSVQLTGQTYVYSRPGVKSLRRDNNGNETTFYYNKGTKINCFGSTNVKGQTWYLLVSTNSNIPEIAWIEASKAIVLSGNSQSNVIPASWYN